MTTDEFRSMVLPSIAHVFSDYYASPPFGSGQSGTPTREAVLEASNRITKNYNIDAVKHTEQSISRSREEDLKLGFYLNLRQRQRERNVRNNDSLDQLMHAKPDLRVVQKRMIAVSG